MEKYHPGWLPRATGHVDIILTVGLSSALKTGRMAPPWLISALRSSQTRNLTFRN